MTATTLFGIYLAPLYAAIAQVESENGNTSDNVYQLSRVYVSDCNRITGGKFDPVRLMWRGGLYDFRDRDRFLDRALSERMIFLYWQHYGREFVKRGITVTPEILANIHRFGPAGAMVFHEQMRTSRYWQRVQPIYLKSLGKAYFATFEENRQGENKGAK